MTIPLKILLVDDDRILLDGLRTLLSAQKEIEVVAALTDGAQAIQLLPFHRIDVALLDIDMPVMDGITTAKKIKSLAPHITIVMLTAFEKETTLNDSLSAGAKGFLTKDMPPDQIVASVLKAHQGETVMGPRPTEILTASFRAMNDAKNSDPQFSEAVANLPKRYQPVFQELLQGSTNKAIAKSCHISEATARCYVSEILALTTCRSRSELLVRAMRTGVGFTTDQE
ncbi:MAG: response regulator transcription factor [Actinomycetaceae bacterium]|nr:response regulator transcription factor [Actinomycetaceae bacterium]